MHLRLLSHMQDLELAEFMKKHGVTSTGVQLMTPKAQIRTIFLSAMTTYAALILKQEALSVGADLACPKDTLCSKKKVSCVLIASDKHLSRLIAKLKMQSQQLQNIATAIADAIYAFDCESWKWKLKDKTIELNEPMIMGIINATDDSFSGDGIFATETALEQKISAMVADGVDIFDVGGESTRPFAPKISKKKEIERVVPVIEFIKKKYPKIPISIDTYKADVAKESILAGASIVNDVSGLRSKTMRSVVAETGAGICIMHMKGTPVNMQKEPHYDDVVADVYDYFAKQMALAQDAGISKQQIVLDVGIGFGKRLEDNLKLIKEHKTFKSLGRPMLLGVSRKSFIGAVLDEDDPQKRILGSSIAHAWGVSNGASILRVHDVKEARQTIKMQNAITKFL